MNSGVYQIRCKVSGRCYIGSAVNIPKRWREHRRGLNAGKHHSRFMLREWNKRGSDSFEFSVLLFCNRSNVLFYEQRAIDVYKPEYNTSPVAGSQIGYRHSEETKRKMSAARTRTLWSPMTGNRHTEETKAKISASRKGKGGGERSLEWRMNIGAGNKGKVITPDQRSRIAATLTGRRQSKETIAKRVLKLKGKKRPVHCRQADRERMLGKKMPLEAVLKMRIAKSSIPDAIVISIRRDISCGMSRKMVASKHQVGMWIVSNIARGAAYEWVQDA